MKNHPWATISLVVGTLRGARSRFLAFTLVTEWGDFAPLFSREGFVMARQLRGSFLVRSTRSSLVVTGSSAIGQRQHPLSTAHRLVYWNSIVRKNRPEKSSGKIVREFTGSDDPELNFTNACNLQELGDSSILVNHFLRGKLEPTHTHSFCQRKMRSVGRSLTTRTLPLRVGSG